MYNLSATDDQIAELEMAMDSLGITYERKIVMAETEKIFGAIIGVMKDVGAVGKDQENTTQRYKYRGIDDVMNALHPALPEQCCALSPALQTTVP